MTFEGSTLFSAGKFSLDYTILEEVDCCVLLSC